MGQIRGRPFQPGNTFGRGRPRGSRNRDTGSPQRLLEDHGEAVLRKCLWLALQGDPTAMRLCVERLLPRRERAVRLRVRELSTAAGVAETLGTVLHDIARGRLTPAEGQTIAVVLESCRRVLETEAILSRAPAPPFIVSPEEKP